MILMETTVASNLQNYLSSLQGATLREWGIDGDSLIRSLQDQLDTGHRHDEMLITAIADALMDSLSRNVLSGQTLQQLRNAVLIPSERAKVAQLIRNGEMGCANCGRDFVSEEMVVLSKSADPNASCRFLLFCSRCMVPRWISCTKGSCKGKAEVPKNLRAILGSSKSICHDHGDKPAEETPQPVGVSFDIETSTDSPGVHPDALTTLNRLRRNAGIPIPAGNIVQSRWTTNPAPIQWTPAQLDTAPSTIVSNMATQEAYMRLMRENALIDTARADVYFDDGED